MADQSKTSVKCHLYSIEKLIHIHLCEATERAMTNVVPFRSKTLSSHSSFARPQGEAAVADAGRRDVARSSRLDARDDLRKTIILLDLALQHARELAKLVHDDRVRRAYDRHLSSIENSLRIARERLVGF
ncbi:MAG: hypothetical protein WA418_03740 [Bradyrhizobium sp.]